MLLIFDWMEEVLALSNAGILDLRNDNAEYVASKVSSSINQSIMIPGEAGRGRVSQL